MSSRSDEETLGKIRKLNADTDKKIFEMNSESEKKIENLKEEICKSSINKAAEAVANIVDMICSGEE